MNTHNIKRLLLAAHRYSYAGLALNYYSLSEMMCEEGISEKVRAYVKELDPLVQGFLDGTLTSGNLDALRNQVMTSMEVITAYTDCFQIFEYVLNRLERRYKNDVTMDRDLSEFTNRVMEYLAISEDNAIMNDRIRQVIGELPVRYTRQKFCQLIREGLSGFCGLEKKSLENMMYLLRSGSMVALPDCMEREYGELFKLLHQLKTADYQHMDKDTYDAYVDRMSWAGEQLFENSGFYMLIQDILNNLYILYLSGGEAMMDAGEKQTMENIVKGVLNWFRKGNTTMIEDEITDLLYELEGIQESAMERYLSCCGPISCDNPLSDAVRKVELLLSGSPFVQLDQAVTEEGTVDRAYLEQTMELFFKELDAVFLSVSKPVVRAIMAKLLSSMPVMFHSVEDLREYIQKSLDSCGDEAELGTAMELIEQEMVIGDAMV